MSNRCGGSGLGGEHGGYCGRDLCLKGRGGVCHPKRNENCSLELANVAATAETENEEPKDYLTCRPNGETVAGVRLNNYTAITTQSER